MDYPKHPTLRASTLDGLGMPLRKISTQSLYELFSTHRLIFFLDFCCFFFLLVAPEARQNAHPLQLGLLLPRVNTTPMNENDNTPRANVCDNKMARVRALGYLECCELTSRWPLLSQMTTHAMPCTNDLAARLQPHGGECLTV